MKRIDPEALRKAYVAKAILADQDSDRYMWVTAAMCAKIVGKYERGATLGLADDMGLSTDTVEDRAHAYWLFERLCNIDDGAHRRFVFSARRLHYIKLSHFRVMYDQQQARNLTDQQILWLLIDIVNAEGGVSSRSLEQVLNDKYGDTKEWTWYGQKAMTQIHKILQHPDTPKEVRDVLVPAYEKLGKKS